jgi:hypothetical protein
MDLLHFCGHLAYSLVSAQKNHFISEFIFISEFYILFLPLYLVLQNRQHRIIRLDYTYFCVY